MIDGEKIFEQIMNAIEEKRRINSHYLNLHNLNKGTPMLFRALLVIASGFIFIFSPGLPMNLISRYSPEYKRDLVYWGIGTWLVSQSHQPILRSSLFTPDYLSGSRQLPVLPEIRSISCSSFSARFSQRYFLGLACCLFSGIRRKKNPRMM